MGKTTHSYPDDYYGPPMDGVDRDRKRSFLSVSSHRLSVMGSYVYSKFQQLVLLPYTLTSKKSLYVPRSKSSSSRLREDALLHSDLQESSSSSPHDLLQQRHEQRAAVEKNENDIETENINRNGSGSFMDKRSAAGMVNLAKQKKSQVDAMTGGGSGSMGSFDYDYSCDNPRFNKKKKASGPVLSGERSVYKLELAEKRAGDDAGLLNKAGVRKQASGPIRSPMPPGMM